MTMKKITMNEEQNNDKKFWLLVGLGAVWSIIAINITL